MIIKKGQTKKERIAKGGIVYDYPVKSKEMGFSVQELNGRVPDEGAYKNKICKEICYVIEGSGKIFIDDEELILDEGDIYFIEPGQKSYIMAEGLKLLTITQPDWYEEQCEVVQ